MIQVLLIAMLSVFSTLLHSNAYSATLPLSAEEETDLPFMGEEEKLARDTYLTLYKLRELTVFSTAEEIQAD